MDTFPRSSKSKLGYDIDQVDDFLASARSAYDADTSGIALTAVDIRRTAFSMVKGGYSTSHVDAALERLEDAFADRGREAVRAESGEEAWLAQSRTTVKAILDRLERPVGHRFDRVSVLTLGYKRQDVDRFAMRLVRHFQDGWPMSVGEVRTATFREQRGGYREAQVDLLLDSVTEVILAAR